MATIDRTPDGPLFGNGVSTENSLKRIVDAEKDRLQLEAVHLVKKQRSSYEDAKMDIRTLLDAVKEIREKLADETCLADGMEGNNETISSSSSIFNSTCSSYEIPAFSEDTQVAFSTNFPKKLLSEFSTKIKNMKFIETLTNRHKALLDELGKFNRCVDQAFPSDISKAYQPIELDERLLCKLISLHFLHYGKFELYKQFIEEAQHVQLPAFVNASNDSHPPAHEKNFFVIAPEVVMAYEALHTMREALQRREIQPALLWLKSNSRKRQRKHQELMFRLHKLKFFSLVFKGNAHRNEAIQYCRENLLEFRKYMKEEIAQMMSSLVFSEDFENSPYKQLYSETMWDDLTAKLLRSFCEVGIRVSQEKCETSFPSSSVEISAMKTEVIPAIPHEPPSSVSTHKDPTMVEENSTILSNPSLIYVRKLSELPVYHTLYYNTEPASSLDLAQFCKRWTEPPVSVYVKSSLHHKIEDLPVTSMYSSYLNEQWLTSLSKSSLQLPPKGGLLDPLSTLESVTPRVSSSMIYKNLETASHALSFSSGDISVTEERFSPSVDFGQNTTSLNSEMFLHFPQNSTAYLLLSDFTSSRGVLDELGTSSASYTVAATAEGMQTSLRTISSSHCTTQAASVGSHASSIDTSPSYLPASTPSNVQATAATIDTASSTFTSLAFSSSMISSTMVMPYLFGLSWPANGRISPSTLASSLSSDTDVRQQLPILFSSRIPSPFLSSNYIPLPAPSRILPPLVSPPALQVLSQPSHAFSHAANSTQASAADLPHVIHVPVNAFPPGYAAVPLHVLLSSEDTPVTSLSPTAFSGVSLSAASFSTFSNATASPALFSASFSSSSPFLSVSSSSSSMSSTQPLPPTTPLTALPVSRLETGWSTAARPPQRDQSVQRIATSLTPLLYSAQISVPTNPSADNPHPAEGHAFEEVPSLAPSLLPLARPERRRLPRTSTPSFSSSLSPFGCPPGSAPATETRETGPTFSPFTSLVSFRLHHLDEASVPTDEENPRTVTHPFSGSSTNVSPSATHPPIRNLSIPEITEGRNENFPFTTSWDEDTLPHDGNSSDLEEEHTVSPGISPPFAWMREIIQQTLDDMTWGSMQGSTRLTPFVRGSDGIHRPAPRTERGVYTTLSPNVSNMMEGILTPFNSRRRLISSLSLSTRTMLASGGTQRQARERRRFASGNNRRLGANAFEGFSEHAVDDENGHTDTLSSNHVNGKANGRKRSAAFYSSAKERCNEIEHSDSEDSEDFFYMKTHEKGMKRVRLPLESPLAVLICSGLIALPRLLQVLELFKHGGKQLSEQLNEWLCSGQIPVELDLGPRFHFHSTFTCAVSRDQTHKDNPPMLLPCGHAICKACVLRICSRRARHSSHQCPMCPSQLNFPDARQLVFE